MSAHIELRPPGCDPVTHEVTGRTEIGREGTDVVVADPSVSRRHLVVEPIGGGLRIEDLGSSYGTFVNGARIDAATVIGPDDEVLIGDTRLRVLPLESPTAPDPVPAERGTVAPSSEPVRPVAAGPIVADLEHLERDGIVVGFVPGSAGADAAPSVLDTARRARRALAGLGSEPWGTRVAVNLVDPFPSADDPNQVVTAGAVIDDATATVWMVVSPESPPEPPHRVLALLFGGALPAADRVEHLLEGYGLHLAGAAEPDPDAVAGLGGTLADLPPDVRGPMVASFVAYLIAREGEATFRTLLATPPAGLAAAWSELYGRSEAALEQAWWHERSQTPSDVGTLEFLRLSWRYLRPYRARQAEIFLLMLLSLAFTATYPFVTKALFDTAIPSGEMSEVLTLLGVLGVAFAISLVAGLRQTVQSAWISGSVVRDLRAEMFAKLQRVPDSWVGRHPQGDVLSRMMSDVGRVQAGLSTAINDGIFQVVALVVSTAIMLRVNLLLGAIVLIGAPVVALVYRRMAGGARERSLAVQEESSAVLRVAQESYAANQVVKLFRLGAHEQRRFARAEDRLFRAQRRLSLFGGLFGLSVESIVTLLRLGVIGLGTWLIFEGRFTLGGLVAFLGVMGEVLNPVTGLTTLGQSIQASVGALVRIDEVFEAEPEPAGDDLPALEPLRSELRLEGVALSYTPDRRALDGVDVTVRAGTKVAFVGGSGSGKSTILRVLMRLYDPDEGRVTVDGVDVSTRSLDSLRAQLGVVFQDSFLFDATIRENIAMGAPGATDDRVLAAARAAEVDAFVDALPRGYDSMVGEGGRNLSGGQRQRVAIARALVADPRILLLDEATSALDPATERQISATLDQVAAGRTVVAITHRLTSVVSYDQIHVVEAGRVVESGTHDELVARGGAYARLWAEQTGEPVPEGPPFDLAGVLAKLPLFAHLEPAALAEVEARVGELRVDTGDLVAEGGDRLVVVERGRAEVVEVPGGAVVRAIGSGEVFGLNALLGAPTGTALTALEPLVLRVLAGDDLAELRDRFPSIAEGQAGRSTLAAAPAGRIVRATLTVSGASADGARTGTGGVTAAAVAAAVAEARATSGTGARRDVGSPA